MKFKRSLGRASLETHSVENEQKKSLIWREKKKQKLYTWIEMSLQMKNYKRNSAHETKSEMSKKWTTKRELQAWKRRMEKENKKEEVKVKWIVSLQLNCILAKCKVHKSRELREKRVVHTLSWTGDKYIANGKTAQREREHREIWMRKLNERRTPMCSFLFSTLFSWTIFSFPFNIKIHRFCVCRENPICTKWKLTHLCVCVRDLCAHNIEFALIAHAKIHIRMEISVENGWIVFVAFRLCFISFSHCSSLFCEIDLSIRQSRARGRFLIELQLWKRESVSSWAQDSGPRKAIKRNIRVKFTNKSEKDNYHRHDECQE